MYKDWVQVRFLGKKLFKNLEIVFSGCNIASMNEEKKLKTVRLDEEIVNQVKDRKKKTYMPKRTGSDIPCGICRVNFYCPPRGGKKYCSRKCSDKATSIRMKEEVYATQ